MKFFNIVLFSVCFTVGCMDYGLPCDKPNIDDTGEKPTDDTGEEHIEQENQKPGAPIVRIQPEQPCVDEDMACVVEDPAVDPDGDPITYRFTWRRNGAITMNKTPLVTADQTLGREEWTCIATPHDGVDEGPPGQASAKICGLGSMPTCPGLSCLNILEQGDSKGDGLYWLDPIEAGPYQAYCDMSTDGGGWTLTMKLDDSANVFHYDAVYWTDTALYNETDHMPNLTAAGTNAKFRSFNEVTGETMRLQFLNPVHNIHYPDVNGQSLMTLFATSDEDIIAGSESNSCNGEQLSALPDYNEALMQFAKARQVFGLNAADSGEDTNRSKMRFGFGSNDEPYNVWVAAIAIGVSWDWRGSYFDHSIKWGDNGGDCNSCGGCYGNGTWVDDTAGNLWIR